MPVLSIKGLDCRRILYESHNDIPVFGSINTFDKDLITVEDTDVYHGIAFDLQYKSLIIGHEVHRQRKISRNILLSQNRLSCRDGTYDRNRSHVLSCNAEAVIDDLDGTRL